MFQKRNLSTALLYHSLVRHFLVSLAAVFWMSRNTPKRYVLDYSFAVWGALRDIQKTAARETRHVLANEFLDGVGVSSGLG